MTAYIDESFIIQFNTEVTHELQTIPSNFQQATRVKTGVVGESCKWQVMGAGSAQVDKPRHAALTPMNVEHDKVTTILKNVHAAEWVDDLDELKTNIQVRGEYAKVVSNAIKNKEDDFVIDALATTTQTLTLPTANTMNKAALIKIAKDMGNAGIPLSDRWVVIHYGAFEDILSETDLQNKDYVATNGYQDGVVKNLFGLNFLVTQDEKMPEATTGRYCYAFWKMAVGFARAKELTTMVERIAERDTYQIMGKSSCGASLILPDAVWAMDVSV